MDQSNISYLIMAGLLLLAFVAILMIFAFAGIFLLIVRTDRQRQQRKDKLVPGVRDLV